MNEHATAMQQLYALSDCRNEAADGAAPTDIDDQVKTFLARNEELLADDEIAGLTSAFDERLAKAGRGPGIDRYEAALELALQQLGQQRRAEPPNEDDVAHYVQDQRRQRGFIRYQGNHDDAIQGSSPTA